MTTNQSPMATASDARAAKKALRTGLRAGPAAKPSPSKPCPSIDGMRNVNKSGSLCVYTPR